MVAASRADVPILLSIVIPTWNRAERLRDQLTALLPHMTDEVELFVSNNGSSDGTQDVLAAAVQAWPERRLRIHAHASNQGADANYVCALRGGLGEWLWLVGDDDPVDFKCLSQVLGLLRDASASVLLLVDRRDDDGVRVRPSDALVVSPPLAMSTFLERQADILSGELLQVGRVLCNRRHLDALLDAPLMERLRGQLHSYLPMYAAGLKAGGLQVIDSDIYPHQPGTAIPRWNLLRGHAGAWRSWELVLPEQLGAVRRREQRLRQSLLIELTIGQLMHGLPLVQADRDWMIGVFTTKGAWSIRTLMLVNVLGTAAVLRFARFCFPNKTRRAERRDQPQTGALHY
jgi:Glycosyl transferase family 2